MWCADAGCRASGVRAGREDSLIVGPDASWLAEAFDRVQDDAEDRDRGFAAHVAQSQTGAGTVVEEAEDGAFAAALADVGEIEGPDDVGEVEGPGDVWRHWPRPPVLELAADRDQLVLALSEHVGDEGLADGYSPSMSMQVAEDDRYSSAPVLRH